MRSTILLVFLLVGFAGFSQSLGVKIGDKIRASSWAYGIQTGELTGVGIQYAKGYACGGRKDDFMKDFFFDLTLGVDRLFQDSETFKDGELLVFGQSLRGQLNFQYTYIHLVKTDFSIGIGAQLGQREAFYDLGYHDKTSVGIRPGLGVEHYFLRMGSGSKPNYLSAFLDAFWYKEIGPSFSDFHLNAGLRLNLFR